MVSLRNKLHYLRVAMVIGAVLVIAAGAFSTRVVAQDTAPVNLTTLSAANVLAYRWQALGRFYTGQPATNLSSLSADDVLAYRWQALARFYTGQPAANLSSLSAADVLAYRWQALARFYTGQPAANLSSLSAADVWRTAGRHWPGSTPDSRQPTCPA